jgi:hypothetical protein
MPEPLTVSIAPTPNPNSLKFTLNRSVSEGRAQTFSAPEQALMSPLAGALLAVPGVKSIFFLRDFITVTREPEAEWEPLAAAVEQALHAHFNRD